MYVYLLLYWWCQRHHQIYNVFVEYESMSYPQQPKHLHYDFSSYLFAMFLSSKQKVVRANDGLFPYLLSIVNTYKGEISPMQLALLFGSFWYLSNTTRRGWFFTSPSCRNHGEKRYCFVVCILNCLYVLHHCYSSLCVVPHRLKQSLNCIPFQGIYIGWMRDTLACNYSLLPGRTLGTRQIRLKISL